MSENSTTGTPCSFHCSTVSLIDFQMTVASLSVAEHALREEPYDRLPYLAGSLQITQAHMETMRQELVSLRGAVMRLHDLLHKANATVVPSNDAACGEIAAALRETAQFTEPES